MIHQFTVRIQDDQSCSEGDCIVIGIIDCEDVGIGQVMLKMEKSKLILKELHTNDII